MNKTKKLLEIGVLFFIQRRLVNSLKYCKSKYKKEVIL